MVSALSASSARVLEHLITRLPAVVAEDPRTYAQYKQVHDALQLPRRGETFGESLQRQGLEDLARWCLENDLPAITGMVVSNENLRPSKGFFSLYKRSKEDFAWWIGQIRNCKTRDWASLLAEARRDSEVADRSNVPASEAGQSSVESLRLDVEFKELLAGFLRADAEHFVTWLPHYRQTVDKVANSMRSGNLADAFNLVWKTDDNGVADAGRGLASYGDVDRLAHELKEQLNLIASDPSPATFARCVGQLEQWKRQGSLKIVPKLMLARAFAAIAPIAYHTTVDVAKHALVLKWMQEHSSFKAAESDNWAEQAAAVVNFLDHIEDLAADPLVRNMLPWFIYRQAATGTDGRPIFTSGFKGRAEQSSAVIEAQTRKIRLQHNLLAKQLYLNLVAQHGYDAVGFEQPSGSGGWIDAVVKLPTGQVWLYEIKVAPTAASAIREAIGQLLEYGFRGSAWKPERLIVVAEPKLDSDSESYLKRLGEKFLLPLEYLQLVLH